jgi:hypothetical protein
MQLNREERKWAEMEKNPADAPVYIIFQDCE